MQVDATSATSYMMDPHRKQEPKMKNQIVPNKQYIHQMFMMVKRSAKTVTPG